MIKRKIMKALYKTICVAAICAVPATAFGASGNDGSEAVKFGLLEGIEYEVNAGTNIGGAAAAYSCRDTAYRLVQPAP